MALNIGREFPVRFFLNIGRSNDRRAEMEWQLFQAGIKAERFPAVDERFVRGARGYAHERDYARALSRRLAIREARQRAAEAVILFEDDVVFHPNFWSLTGRIVLPDDWGMFILGCVHEEKPDVVSEGLVRAKYAVDSHAVAIRAPYFSRVIEALNQHGKSSPDLGRTSDQVLAELQREIPTYAALPNLVLQSEMKPGSVDKQHRRHGKPSVAKQSTEITRSCLEEMVIGSASEKQVCLGLVFLTREDVNHPTIWQEWIDQAPDRVRIFSHIKHPEKVNGGFLAGTEIKEYHETSWGEIGLVSASRAVLLKALENEDLTHFMLLSESCVPVKPLMEVLRRLRWNPRSQFRSRDLEAASELQKSRASAAPEVIPGCWRFQPQWWLLDRTSAVMATRVDYTELFENMFAPDEAYFSTVLAIEGYPSDDLVFDEPITWTHWEKNSGSPLSHHMLSTEYLHAITHSHALFARKFPPEADIGRFGLHLPACE